MDKFTMAAATTESGVVEEIMSIHGKLPPRPSIEEVEAAKTLISNVEREEQLRLEAIAKMPKSKEVSDELFCVYQDMQRGLVYFQSKEQKREALKLLDLENAHQMFADLILRACQCVSPNSDCGPSSSVVQKRELNVGVSGTAMRSRDMGSIGASTSFYSQKMPVGELFTRDDSYVKNGKASIHIDGFGGPASPQIVDSTLKIASSSAQDGEQLSLIKLASLIEISSKKGTLELNLQSKLSDQIEWLPDSIGKLSSLVTLNLSENQVVELPSTIGGLSSLASLDLHSNRIGELPDAIGDLLNLVFLDLSGNNLSKLPSSLARLIRLEELDLSSNQLYSLPDIIGSLVNLKKLNVETNNLEELPYTIGQCSSLRELRVDYNRLKALPEAVGKIETLEILSVRYNNLRQLPTSMSSLTKLRELDLSFNELESVPESLCFATSLVRLNISNNFANLRSIPRSIGNLEMLEELDMSNNQIRILPDSFRALTRLSVLRTDQNPLEVPPRDIAEMGAKAVVQYMEQLVASRNVQAHPKKKKKNWLLRLFSRSRKSEYSSLGM